MIINMNPQDMCGVGQLSYLRTCGVPEACQFKAGSGNINEIIKEYES